MRKRTSARAARLMRRSGGYVQAGGSERAPGNDFPDKKEGLRKKWDLEGTHYRLIRGGLHTQYCVAPSRANYGFRPSSAAAGTMPMEKTQPFREMNFKPHCGCFFGYRARLSLASGRARAAHLGDGPLRSGLLPGLAAREKSFGGLGLALGANSAMGGLRCRDFSGLL